MLEKLGWYIERVRGMSLPEILYRFFEIYKKLKIARLKIYQDTECNLPDPKWGDLFQGGKDLRLKVYGEPTPSAFGIIWPQWNESEVGWNKFASGRDTQSIPCFKVRYRNSVDLSNDIRFTWELNRLTWLIPWAFSENQQSKERSLYFLRDFLLNDKPGFGSRWNSMIELAMQSLAIQVLGSLLFPQINQSDRASISSALSNRFLWLETLPSRYSSANNHLIAELVAQISILESMGNSEKSLVKQEDLIEQLRLQTNHDGLNAERSSAYHLFVLDLLVTLQFLWPNLARVETFKEITTTLITATHKLRMGFQTWPSFGDSDDACLISCLVSIENRAEFLEGFCPVIPTPDMDGVITFPASGLTLLRKEINSGSLSVLVDHGPFGYLQIAGHRHADTLSIWMTLNKSPILIEGGTFSYHSNLPMRNTLRSGWLHNTVTINGESLSRPSGPFLWNPKHAAIGVLNEVHSTEDETGAVVQTQYPKTKFRKKGTVVRKVDVSPKGIRIFDKVNNSFSIESHFILSPQLRIARGYHYGEMTFVTTDGSKLTFKVTNQSNLYLTRVDISNSYGILESTYRLSVVGKRQNSIEIEIVSKVEI